MYLAKLIGKLFDYSKSAHLTHLANKSRFFHLAHDSLQFWSKL